MVRNQGRVTRFVVMAMLQAARARALGLPIEAAYSWGLNRAIFIAAAKSGFRGGSGGGEGGPETPAKAKPRPTYQLGDDEAFRDPDAEGLVFRIGDEDQTVEKFDQQVRARFGTKADFEAAWDEAMKIVEGYDRAVLESRRGFYEEIYRPRRDELSDRWTRDYSPPPKRK